MLLEHLGECEAAQQVMAAIESVTSTPSLHTRDLGGSATTVEVTQAVCDFLGGARRERAAA
jgi:tartrate dehydrogenase/decarboxylase/D-malate dehydrogenase